MRTLTEGIRWTIRPGSGDLPVGQFDAQNLLPNGNGIPSLASSVVGISKPNARDEESPAYLDSREMRRMSMRERQVSALRNIGE